MGKRIRTPKSWMLDKLTGVYAPRPRQGPHKLRECLPLQLVLRNKLKYALSGRECDIILGDKDNTVKVDNKVRRDKKFPVGLMDVVSIPKTGDNYRMLYDVKGRFTLVKIKSKDEQNIKHVMKLEIGKTVFTTGGSNRGRVGTIVNRTRL